MVQIDYFFATISPFTYLAGNRLEVIAARHGALVAVVNPTSEGQRTGERIRHLTGPSGELLPRLVAAAWPDPPSA